jgi:hypothetical protein
VILGEAFQRQRRPLLSTDGCHVARVHQLTLLTRPRRACGATRKYGTLLAVPKRVRGQKADGDPITIELLPSRSRA